MAGNNVIVFLRVAEHLMNTFFKQIAIERSGAHHFDFGFNACALLNKLRMQLRLRFYLVVNCHQAHQTALALHHVIGEINTQQNAQNRKKIAAAQRFPDEYMSVDNSVHPFIESYSILVRKRESDGDSKA